jgi:DNA-binding response OmpR family regulator
MAGKQKKIFLVEDDPFLSALLKSRLTKEGFDVIHVKDGEEAVNLLRDIKPDIILMDIILPRKSGFEVMEEMKADPQISNAPVMIISNLGQDSDIQRGKELGAVEYFVKAKISIDELIEKIKEFLDSHPT